MRNRLLGPSSSSTETQPRTLSVEGTGDGDGNVSDAEGGAQVDCDVSTGSTSGDCTEEVDDGSTVTLSATADDGSAFIGWTGCDNPTGEQCEMTLDADKTVTAEFDRAPLVVNSVGDSPDEDSGDEACDTGETVTCDGDEEPECTLRAAIEEANAMNGEDEIEFGIPDVSEDAPTILPGSELPENEGPVEMDGATQPGANRVILDGGSASGTDGLRLDGAGRDGQRIRSGHG